MNASLQTAVTLANLPWEDRPQGCQDVFWRYSGNPIIPRNLIPSANSIFNSAVVPYKDGFAGVFRCDNKRRQMNLHSGHSADGIHWQISDRPIGWVHADGELANFEHRYDPRVTYLEDCYYVTGCNGYHGPTIGIGYTFDFETFHFLENALLPYNRNGVLFPRKIGGKYTLLSRSPDLVHWGEHRFVMSPKEAWESTKIGAGPVPIETPEGWLLIYHGVLTSCNGFVYSFGAALLDLEQPWKVIRRAAPYLLSPQTLYECVGDVPNVVFPCATLYDAKTGRLALYYGGADTVTALAFAYLDEVLGFIKDNAPE